MSRFDFLGDHRDGRQGLAILILPLGVPTSRIRVETGESGGLVEVKSTFCDVDVSLLRAS